MYNEGMKMKYFISSILLTCVIVYACITIWPKPGIDTKNVFVAYVDGNEYIINNIDNVSSKGDFFIMKTSDHRQIRLYQVGNTTIKLVEQKLQQENGVVVETEGVVHVK